MDRNGTLLWRCCKQIAICEPTSLIMSDIYTIQILIMSQQYHSLIWMALVQDWIVTMEHMELVCQLLCHLERGWRHLLMWAFKLQNLHAMTFVLTYIDIQHWIGFIRRLLLLTHSYSISYLSSHNSTILGVKFFIFLQRSFAFCTCQQPALNTFSSAGAN